MPVDFRHKLSRTRHTSCINTALLPPPTPQHALPPYPLLLPLLVLLQYRDLPADTYLSLSVYELSEGRPMLLVGSTSMPLFSKKGRLKTGQQRLQVCLTH